MMLLLGIDDAGRGPLIGPMFLAGVLIRDKQENDLKTEGAKDSKLLSHKERIRIGGLIKDMSIKYKIVNSQPDEIDHSINSGVNLNTLEALKVAEIINELVIGIEEKIKVIVDCPSVNIIAWKATLLGFVKEKSNLDICCEHKADFFHPVVSAASILAKVAREESIEELKKRFDDFGSGYPSDPKTILFMKKNGDKLRDSGIFRKTWATWKSIFPDAMQETLNL